MIGWLISVGDAVSQLLGRCIIVRYDGKWQPFTRNANESISGASNWHADNGRWGWVELIIDLFFWAFEEDHCLHARIADRTRAAQLLASRKPKG